MNNQKTLLADFLDWKGTYRALPPIHRFIFLALIGIELDSYLMLLTDNLATEGSFGILEVTFRLTHIPLVAIAVDLLFTVGYLYLSFWFLKKGLENGDKFALILFGITLTSTTWIGLILN
ncbi:MAG: hypothetical protein WCA35_19025 [Kovacikia sp.]